MSLYRTRTYIAADFDHDRDAVEQLEKWNESSHWSLHFTSAHDLQSSRDTSLYCSIKESLAYRMSGSKRFVLIVGNHTDYITKGGCQYCESYNSYTRSCARGRQIDYRSYIEFECELALKAGISIIVLYKDTERRRELCPLPVCWRGIHVPMLCRKEGKLVWDYESVCNAFSNS